MNQSYYESVRNQFERLRKALQEDGQTVNMCECMFLGYALDCIKLADEEFQFELDGSESSLLQFDEILHAAHLAYQTGELKEADLAEFSKLFAGYAGTVLIQQLGGVWTYAQDVATIYLWLARWRIVSSMMSLIQSFINGSRKINK